MTPLIASLEPGECDTVVLTYCGGWELRLQVPRRQGSGSPEIHHVIITTISPHLTSLYQHQHAKLLSVGTL